MKKVVMNYLMNLIKKNNNYDEEKLAIIRYGLEGLYLTITKFIIILLLIIVINKAITSNLPIFSIEFIFYPF